MDKKLQKYFCIFCDNCITFETMSEAYNHYKNHMKVHYYCNDCDNDRKCVEEDHNSNDKTLSVDETGVIEMWIERFLSYQSEVIDKTYSDLFKSCKLFTGCAVCQTFLRLSAANDVKFAKGNVQWSHNEALPNEVRHVCSHLRYYPFECNKCESDGRYHKKCDLAEITRHIRNSHSYSLRDNQLETLVKIVKINKLEEFIHYCCAQRKSNSQSIAPPDVPTPTRTSKRVLSQSQRTPTEQHVKCLIKRSRIETKIIPIVCDNDCNSNLNEPMIKISGSDVITKRSKSTDNTSSGSLRFNPQKIKTDSQKKIVMKINRHSLIKSDKVEIKFKPIVKTYSNLSTNMSIKTKQNLISGDQIIIKKSAEVCNKRSQSTGAIIKTKPVVYTNTNFNLSQQFSDLMDTEDCNQFQQIDINEHNFNSESNTGYFCIFCTENFTVKEIAYQHIQKHIDYYPIVCLLCGEGITDIQEFIKHHRQTHPKAVKGKYKKKEQPLYDKWISAYLYSQTTMIRSFPPRETCPVCDRVFAKQDIMKNKPRRCTINRKIDHLYRHLSYLPYECVLCKQAGNEFYVAYFESKAHSHIKLKHPEIDDNEARWDVFQKTISIPKLDEFIENYLTQFGISMQMERRPVKKSLKYGSPNDTTNEMDDKKTVDSLEIANTSLNLNLNMIFSNNIDSLDSPHISPRSNNNNIITYTKVVNKDEVKPEVDIFLLNNNNDKKSVLNESNNNSNDSDMIVNVSPLPLIERNAGNVCDDELYFCIFCPEVKYFTKIEAYSHYGSHIDYLPVMCNICDTNFSDVDHLMSHHKSEHSTRADVDYEICEDQTLVKWVNEFLDSQILFKKVMTCSCSYNCPVCIKLLGNQISDSVMPCFRHNDVQFSGHIHKHLNYFPYECIICKRNGRIVRVPNLDSIAINHMKEHKLDGSSMSLVIKNFPKTLVIPRLERLIGDCVYRKRVSEKKNRIEFNPLHHNISNDNSISITPLNCEVSPPYTRKQHIRLEGGRVVNLPPKSILEITEMIPGSNGLSTMAQYRCLHCSNRFANKRLFKIHHNQTHEGKPILCSKSA
ncbi:uncharacterized protein LOC128959447 [Oppia nitens]|uniref:uncharacterized protein LOC128959447 n=1 Tax=Oppia nitens TaxID=1686743 RepID=UPI0023DC8FFC|nr:uncharacterized protein LOC128959447 [Oppia nitens]